MCPRSISILRRSVHGVLSCFPFLAQPADRCAQTHGQRGNGFQPLFSSARPFAVVFPVDLHQQEFRVPKDSRQRVVQFVTQHFAKILLHFLKRRARCPPQLAPGASGCTQSVSRGLRFPRLRGPQGKKLVSRGVANGLTVA